MLEKIAGGNKETANEEKDLKIEENISHASKQEPISLSKLKEADTNHTVKTPNVMPVKEASEEKKASLKDVLARINTQAPKPIETKIEEKPKEVIAQKEEVFVKPEPIIIPEVKIEEAKPEVKEEIPKVTVEEKPKPEIIRPAFVQDYGEAKPTSATSYGEAKEEQKESPATLNSLSDNNSWQKRKAKKEVPEDVLRKVLE